MDHDLQTPPRAGSNLTELSVSELSRALKRTVEDAFGYVRVRGEVSAPKRHSSGHVYLRLKDADAVLDAVCWRGVASRLSVQPEEGLEVICTGRLTTYPGRSQYQLVIETMEMAGEGALLKQIEERKKRLAAEGLFEPARKRRLPFLPEVIGVVTSPTGAVIRDILHRLNDRFPRRVIVWPTAVQGEGAAAQVAAAIRGFDALAPNGPIPRPDVLIVARGGGSLEDLMAFNEEIVVRAAAECRIPLISAVGHETDTTLIDHVADRRAPTPTAAAEMAVPVRAELAATVLGCAQRLAAASARSLTERRTRVEGLARGLGDPRRLVETAQQRLDDRAERLGLALPAQIERRRHAVVALAGRLRHPREQAAAKGAELKLLAHRLNGALRQTKTRARDRLAALRLDHQPLQRLAERREEQFKTRAERLRLAAGVVHDRANSLLASLGQRLESVSPKQVLNRGYAIVRDADGAVIGSAKAASPGQAVRIEFGDGEASAVVAGSAPEAKPKRKKEEAQGSLL